MHPSHGIRASNNNYSAAIKGNLTSQADEVCRSLLGLSLSSFKEPLPSSVSSILFNVVSALFTGFVNFIVIFTVMRKRQLRTAANMILTNMAVSDFLTAILMQPLKMIYKFLLVLGLQTCDFKRVALCTAASCTGASFFTISFFALDRLFATVFPYRYLEETIFYKYIAIILLTWVLLVLTSVLTIFEVIAPSAFHALLMLMFLVVVPLVIISYSIIYWVTRDQRQRVGPVQVTFSQRGSFCDENGDIEAGGSNDTNKSKTMNLQVPQASANSLGSGREDPSGCSTSFNQDEAGSVIHSVSKRIDSKLHIATINVNTLAKSEGNLSPANSYFQSATNPIDSAKEENSVNPSRRGSFRKGIATLQRHASNQTVLIIVGAFLLCYLPVTIFNLLSESKDFGQSTSMIVYDWTNNVVLLNSAINPIIYCWRVGFLRREMKITLRRFCRGYR